MEAVPTIDLADLRAGRPEATARAIDAACREVGFFMVVNHGVDLGLLDRLDALARAFFALPEAEKAEVAMARGGLAWRGWFPLRGERTGDRADEKEGLYFGTELGAEDPRVRGGLPLHGPNLFPRRPAGLRDAVLGYLEQATELGQQILGAMAMGLGLPRAWFQEQLTTDPVRLLRIFRYPPTDPQGPRAGVGEHADYGLLTLLATDGRGGLEVKLGETWAPVRPPRGTFVVNLGDMLERLTGGVYRSTLHRVVHHGSGDRISIPFFLDPSWEAEVPRLPIVSRPPDEDAAARWDQFGVHGFEGSYGDYLTAKVAKVFPDLAEAMGLARGPQG